MTALDTTPEGLDQGEASSRLLQQGKNLLKVSRRDTMVRLFFGRMKNPLLLILIFAASISTILRDWVNASIVLAIVLVSSALSAWQEYRASNAVDKLRERIRAKVKVLRGGVPLVIASEGVVAGDIVLLAAGDLVPADGLLLEATDLFVNQSLLTGETFPAEKSAGTLSPPDAGIAARGNCVFMGTSVRSGMATAVIVSTGRNTAFGEIAGSLEAPAQETQFEKGIRRFGGLLMRVMVLMVLAVLTVNILFKRPALDTLLFAVALAVGLSPELLPAILSITLARGAQRLAGRGVIVRRLNAIENLGSMDVLCTDKTGTLTRGVVQLDAALNSIGEEQSDVFLYASLNAVMQTGMANPLDQAIVVSAQAAGLDLTQYRKLDEIPYDFIRKRLSVVVADASGGNPFMITKGALANVLEVCSQIVKGDEVQPMDAETLQRIHERFAHWSSDGFRVLGIARRDLSPAGAYHRDDEHDMSFMGFLLFFDPPESGVQDTLAALHRLHVDLKIITGDNQLVARHVAEAVGMRVKRIITGSELRSMKDEALWHLAPGTTLFAEVDPNQKERIIAALQRSGHTVGYLGDGINDAPALQSADVGISVDTAVDVAKEAADFVLLEHDLTSVRLGIDEGRRTFANTLKYIFITTSANFGNMISVALASLFLPFLPMLAQQILLNNFLSDIPAIGIPGDHVDREWERTPHRWNVAQIRDFMVFFGLISTLFDAITVVVLLILAGEAPAVFRTGWFVESLLTEVFILFVIRTYKPFYKSWPTPLLTWSAVSVGALTILLPYTPIGELFAFVPLPANVMASIAGITLAYLLVSESTKHFFFRRYR